MKFYITAMLFFFYVTPALASDGYRLQVVRQDAELVRLQRIIAFQTKTGVRVHGHVTANRANVLLRGQVTVSNYAGDGSLISETTKAMNPTVLSHRLKRKGGVGFSVDLPGDIPAGSTLKVVYHPPGSTTTATQQTNLSSL